MIKLLIFNPALRLWLVQRKSGASRRPPLNRQSRQQLRFENWLIL